MRFIAFFLINLCCFDDFIEMSFSEGHLSTAKENTSLIKHKVLVQSSVGQSVLFIPNAPILKVVELN